MKKYLIRLGEISLKGLNRTSFQARLCNNIKEKLLPHHVKIQSQKGRLFLYTEDDVPRDLVFKVLNTTFGLDGYSECHSTEDKTVDGLFVGIQLGKKKLDMENLFAVYCQFGLDIVSRIEMIVPYGQSW